MKTKDFIYKFCEKKNIHNVFLNKNIFISKLFYLNKFYQMWCITNISNYFKQK